MIDHDGNHIGGSAGYDPTLNCFWNSSTKAWLNSTVDFATTPAKSGSSAPDQPDVRSMKHPSMTRILSHFEESARLAQDLLGDARSWLRWRKEPTCWSTPCVGTQILSCGNGGSMCDAMHFAEELSGRYREDRPPFAALACQTCRP